MPSAEHGKVNNKIREYEPNKNDLSYISKHSAEVTKEASTVRKR